MKDLCGQLIPFAQTSSCRDGRVCLKEVRFFNNHDTSLEPWATCRKRGNHCNLLAFVIMLKEREKFQIFLPLKIQEA